jgi:hypothetical protein
LHSQPPFEKDNMRGIRSLKRPVYMENTSDATKKLCKWQYEPLVKSKAPCHPGDPNLYIMHVFFLFLYASNVCSILLHWLRCYTPCVIQRTWVALGSGVHTADGSGRTRGSLLALPF